MDGQTDRETDSWIDKEDTLGQEYMDKHLVKMDEHTDTYKQTAEWTDREDTRIR